MMKSVILGAALALVSTSAMAYVPDFSMPDFEMIRNYEKSVIAKDPKVIAYARKLGAKSIRVTNGAPGNLNYAVKTNNGCLFSVDVVYNDWPGIDAIIVYKDAVCKR